jgi:hypothetical protein
LALWLLDVRAAPVVASAVHLLLVLLRVDRLLLWTVMLRLPVMQQQRRRMQQQGRRIQCQ